MKKSKDLILITAHCPNQEKRKILHDLVMGLQPARKDFDLMVVSHTPITFDVQESVDWAIYDRDNELLTEWKYQNQPWFKPDSRTIHSIFFGSGNTYVALHKQLITGYSLARSFGYEKIHCIEYDALYLDFTEFYDNSKILEEYDSVLYTTENGYGEINIDWGLGCFHSAKIKSLPERAFYYDSEVMKKEIEESLVKTTEKRTQDLYGENGNKIFFKDHSLLTRNGNMIRLVNFHAGDLDMQWAVPYYDPTTDTIDFVAWNDSSDSPANVCVIVNNKELFSFQQLGRYQYHIEKLGNPEEIKEITILINNKMKCHFELIDENLLDFKLNNFAKYEQI